MAEVQSRTLLIVGEPRVGDSALAADVRTVAKPPESLEVGGLFAFRSLGGWDAMFVVDGNKRSASAFASREMEDTHWCMRARSWRDYLWEQAAQLAEPTHFRAGDQVRLVGSERVGTIKAIEHGSRTVYNVWFGPGDQRTLGDASLEAFSVNDSDPATWMHVSDDDHRGFARTLTCVKLSEALTDTIYSYKSSRTTYRPYQFRPVLKMITGDGQRILIADEVGLGKTIEAGLIWTELAQRTDLRRVLVVCPAMLVIKWQTEMDRRFDRKLDALNRERLRDIVKVFEEGDADTPISAVISLEALRGSPDLEALAAAQPRFDLIIVDEAHYMRNSGTKNFAVGELLGDWAEALIFLSATPLNLGQNDLFSLMHLLRPELFTDRTIFGEQLAPNRHLNDAASMLLSHKDRPEEISKVLRRIEAEVFAGSVIQRTEYGVLVELLESGEPLTIDEIAEARRLITSLNILGGALSRTRKVDVPDAKAVREPRLIDVPWTETERRLYSTVLEYCRTSARRSGKPPGFVMQMPLRQAASCLPAMREWAEGRAELDADEDPLDDEVLDLDDWPEETSLSDHVSGGLRGVFDASHALGDVDTKFDTFRDALLDAKAQGLRQVMVFSFFRRTLAYLHQRLREEFSVRVMHGGIPIADRGEIIDSFRNGDFDILLVSEVGSEGLDFEFCNVLVNYDLPWNPMRVEQRIGRLDRFGQQHEKIFIYNFHVPGTIETDIYERLYDRIRVFHDSIGELEPILRDSTRDLVGIALDPDLTDEQRTKRVAEIEVAWSDRGHDLNRLTESQGMLAGLDMLLIDGLERDVGERGRFVGAPELRSLVEYLVSSFGGAIGPGESAESLEVRGTEKLAAFLNASSMADASRMGLAALKNACYYRRPLELIFDGEHAGLGHGEFVGARHPLVRAAVERWKDSAVPSARYAVLGLPSAVVDSPTLVLFHLVETTGLRPRRELIPTAVDVYSFLNRDEVGFGVLQGLAAGTLTPAQTDVAPEVLAAALHHARSAAEQLRYGWERQRAEENAALVDARAASQVAAIGVKIEQARATLEQVRQKDARVKRLYLGRIRNLQAKQYAVEADLSSRRSLAVSLKPVGIALVVPI